MKNGDLPAAPIGDLYAHTPPDDDYFRGLSKREVFAIAAMQGLCANGIPGTHNTPLNLSKEAVIYADALLDELESDNENT